MSNCYCHPGRAGGTPITLANDTFTPRGSPRRSGIYVLRQEGRLAIGEGYAQPFPDRTRAFARERKNVGQEGFRLPCRCGFQRLFRLGVAAVGYQSDPAGVAAINRQCGHGDF